MKPSRAKALALSTCLHAIVLASALGAADCNRNGVEDSEDVLPRFTLGVPTRLVLTDSIDSLKAVDVDDDGDLDLLAAHGTAGAISIQFNRGNGTFHRETRLVSSPGTVFVTLADVDGDGLRDVVAAPVASGERKGFAIYRGEGSGSFGAARIQGDDVNGRSLGLGDVDQDGDIDVVAIGTGTITTFMNDGKGNFAATASINTVETALDVSLADHDRNGLLDLVAVFPSGDCKDPNDCPFVVRLYMLADIKGTFRTVSNLSCRAESFLAAAGDTDGDGILELAIASRKSRPEVARPVGLLRLGGGRSQRRGSFETVAFGPTAVEIADLDGDGNGDVIVASSRRSPEDSLLQVLDMGEEFFRNSKDYILQSPVSALASGDFDGDGDRDVAAAVAEPRGVAILWNLGKGALSAPISFPQLSGRMDSALVADIDDDGAMDMIAGTRKSPWVSILSQWRDGRFGSWSSFETLESPTAMAAGLFSNDSILDIALAHEESESVSILINEVAAPNFLRYRVEGKPVAIAAYDFNGDGWDDIVTSAPGTYYSECRCYGGFHRITFLRNRGDANFTLFAVEETDRPIISLLAVDLDGDTSPELLGGDAGDPVTGKAAVHVLQGQGSLFPPMEFPVASLASRLTAADFTGDGIADLIATGDVKGSTILISQRNGNVLKIDLKVGGTDVATGDFDGDATVDVALLSGQAITVLLNAGEASFREPMRFEYGEPMTILRAIPNVTTGISSLVAYSTPAIDPTCDCLRPSFPLAYLTGVKVPPYSLDKNRDLIPDECAHPLFRRGDPDETEAVNLTDAIVLYEYLFLGREVPRCLEAADIDNDGAINLTDPIYLLHHMFLGGRSPAAPWPACGIDADVPESPGSLGCTFYPGCS